MARTPPRTPSTTPTLVEADIVNALIKNPADLPKLVVLKGFLGMGSTPGSWRVYLNHAFTDYYEIENRDDIKHVVAISEDEGQRVWIRHGAATRLVRSRAGTAERPQLLEGSVVQAHLGAAPVAQPRWVPGMVQGDAVPRQGIDWLPYDDPGFEVTKCYQGCFSYSP